MAWFKRLLIAALILLSNHSYAGSVQSLTVEECIALGFENSPELHSSKMKIKSAEAEASEYNALRLPSISLSGSYMRLSDIPPFQVSLPFSAPFPDHIVISEPILNNYGLRLSLQQPVFTGFRLHQNYKIAKYNAQAAIQDYMRNNSQLVYNVKNAYWSLYKAIEFKKLVDENITLVESHLKDVENFWAQGLVTRNEVLKVGVQLSEVKLLLIDAENAVQLAMITLNSLIGLPLNNEVLLESVAGVPVADSTDLNAVVKMALENRCDIKAMRNRIKAGEAAVKMAKAGWYPQLFLSANYYYSRPNPRILPAEDEYDETWDVGMLMTFDIWNWGKTAHQANKAKAQLSQANDALILLRDAVTLEATSSYLEMLKARDKIGIAEQSVLQAQENYDITNETFQAGAALNSDLLDAEVALLRAKTNLTEATVNYELALAKLNKSMGK